MPGRWYWYLVTAALAALVLVPIGVLVASWKSVDTEIWAHLWDTQLARVLFNTAVLAAGVGCGVTLLGVGLGWLTSACDFPGRRWLDWALMLPFAVPAYVLAFVFVGMCDFAGPVQSTLREWFGPGLRFPPVRSTGGVILVLVLVFYPYVYLLARSAFLTQGRGFAEAARLLGCTPWRAFWRIALPVARPAIAAGVALALMETLADFGAVSVFNYDTFTTLIYKTWYGFFSLASAAQLASLLLLMVLLGVGVERYSRGKIGASQERPRIALYKLRGIRAWTASGACLTVFAVAFVIPLMQLVLWCWRRGRFDLDERYLALVGHSLYLAGVVATLAVTAAMSLALAKRRAPHPAVRLGVNLANLGYAIPGSVLAVAIMLAFSYLDSAWIIPLARWFGGAGEPMLLGSLAGLLLACLARFLTAAHGPLDAALDRLRPALPEAARGLGVGGARLYWRVHLPLLAPALSSAALLVFVDVIKEMPATLLLRPFGWDTLAVRVFEMTSEGEWARASLPALSLVAVGLLPVVLLIRRSARVPGIPLD